MTSNHFVSWLHIGDLQVAKALGPLDLPRYAIRGDHDFEPRTGLWSATIADPGGASPAIRVTATAADGSTVQDEIRVGPARVVGELPGHHDNAVDPWPGHALLGTRLGPNANGKKW